ncbi:HTH-type transcriptional repressor FabR [Alkalimarinus sediminis]|uniref:HTH-type transcriptional repressor FabR n=2 Tax=Alkalimarinus sediminis TaxID=1632866 RepID=A0A9E8KQU3_9ALTE|nr:HTH-type transcriptional repressor FabR [Alkalimarinus sediminis]
MDAALNQLTADRGFANLSLREVAREAGIAPTSFYRHFNELDELGLALVDEAGLALRQLMRQARKRIEKNSSSSSVSTSIDTFMEYLASNTNHFRLLLRERTGLSKQFRTAIKAEIDHFSTELSEDLRRAGELKNRPIDDPQLVAEAMVTVVFNQGSEALDCTPKEKAELKERLKKELRIILRGAEIITRENQKAAKES